MPVNEVSAVSGPVPTHRIILFHPGSLYVRAGRASDLVPTRTLHCVARRRKHGGQSYRDPFLPPSVPKTKELVEELEECRLQVSHSLQSCLQSNGARRYATPPQQIAAFNRRSNPEYVTDGASWPDMRRIDTVIGDAVLDLDPDLPFNIHFPYKRGDFNLHNDIGGSVTSVLNDMFTIWSWIIEHKLGIPLIELAKYRCVVLVPDIYNRAHLKYLMSLVLKDLGFGHCFLVQESVSGAFGAGISCACVVDVGDQKTAISCVEDGISHKTTRLRIDYGAGDVVQTLAWLFHKSAFPYKLWNETVPRDVMLMRNLYQDFCHINVDICGAQEKSFIVDHPGETTYKYILQVGDECLISPLAMFNTDLLAITGPKSTRTQQRITSDPDDPFDAEYLRETGRKKETADMANDSQQIDTTITECQQSGNPDEEIVVDALEVPTDGVAITPGQVLPLDAAILQSIERCPTEEIKRKMYGNILIIGGGTKVEGIASWLQTRLYLQMPFMYKSDAMEIVGTPKDIDPAATAWRGASVMSCLESAAELWISQREWSRCGVRVLRERAPFMW